MHELMVENTHEDLSPQSQVLVLYDAWVEVVEQSELVLDPVEEKTKQQDTHRDSYH